MPLSPQDLIEYINQFSYELMLDRSNEDIAEMWATRFSLVDTERLHYIIHMAIAFKEGTSRNDVVQRLEKNNWSAV